MRTGFIDDLRNCKQCGSLEHENDLRDDLCPNCYYDVGRFKEEREKTKADNKWLNKWQKLKKWLNEQQNNFRLISKTLGKADYVLLSNCIKSVLSEMAKLESEDE